MKTVLSCCASGGLYFRASIPTDKENGQHFGMSSKDGGIQVSESHQVKKTRIVNKSEWNKSKQIFEYHDEEIEYFDTEEGFRKLFPTIDKAVEYLNDEHGLKIIYEK